MPELSPTAMPAGRPPRRTRESCRRRRTKEMTCGWIRQGCIVSLVPRGRLDRVDHLFSTVGGALRRSDKEHLWIRQGKYEAKAVP